MNPISNSTANALRRLDDFDHLDISDRFDVLVEANLLDALVKDDWLPRFTREEALENSGVDPDNDRQVREALNEYSRHDVWRGHAMREEFYLDDHISWLDSYSVLEVASSTYGMDWDPQNEDPYLAAVERLVIGQRREALGNIAQDSRPCVSDLASPEEAMARRNRGRCM
jgi:hypothetical protein